MGIEVIYPEVHHETKSEFFGDHYIFTCPICGYQRKVWITPNKPREILNRGDCLAAHSGEAGMMEGMGICNNLRTAMNDGAARLMLGN